MPPPAIMEGEGKAISAAEAAAYKKAGVLVKHGFFDAREVAAMQRTVREFKRSELLYDSEPCTSLLCPCPYESVIDASGLRTVYTGAGGEGKGEMMYMATPAVISRLFRSLLFKPEVKAALSALLGGPAGCSNGQFFTKPARTGLGTMWHQDNAYFHLPDPVDGIAMWIVRLICCPRRTEL